MQVQSFEWSILCDPLFTARLDLFSRIVNDFTTCFRRCLSRRRDASFFVLSQLCRFIRKLCSRCYQPGYVPKDGDWFALLDFTPNEEHLLQAVDVLEKMKLTSKVEAGCKLKAEQTLIGKHVEKSALLKQSDAYKAAFGVDTRNFLLHVLNQMLKISFETAEIVKGLACFDSEVLFHKSQDFAVGCFDKLYETFLLRKWVFKPNEQACREEYHDLLDHLRTYGSGSASGLSAIPDIVAFLSTMPLMQDRPHLLHIFKLSCLCLTEIEASPVEVLYSEVDTSDPRCCFTDVIRPSQSFLSNVPNAVACCVTEENLSRFLGLSINFSDSSFASTYDPWLYVDSFGRQKIYKSLVKTYNTPAVSQTGIASPTASLVSSLGEQSPIKMSKRPQLKRQFGDVSRSERKEVVDDLRQSSSKN